MSDLATHLVGVTFDRPHPRSACAHLPLRSELEYGSSYDQGYDDGYEDALEEAEEQVSSLRETSPKVRP